MHLWLQRWAGCGGSGGNPAAGAAGSAGRVCTSSACISLSGLARSIDAQLRGNVVGYVALVGQSQVVSSGLARTAADPPKLAMGPNVMVNVASVGKMFTTIAVLKSLARHHLSIDSRIWPFLPPDWVKGPGIDTITFRELLTHRAGFRLDSDRVFATDNAAREQVRQGIQQIDKQVADYNNINFTIFRDMLPFMEGVPDPGQPRAAQPRPAFSSAMFSVRSSIRWASRTPRARQSAVPCSCTRRPTPGPHRGVRPRWGHRVLRRRRVYDTGQHAPGP